MPKLVATLTVLLLALQMPSASARRSLQGGNDWGRSVDSPQHQSTLAIDLIPYHHFESPFAQPNLTLSQRVEIAVQSSQARAQFLSSRISGEDSVFGTGKVFTSPLSQNHGQGSYIMEISLGTPARKLWAIADTGSTLTWVQCIDCLNASCFTQPNPHFNPTASSSYSSIACDDPVCIPQVGTTTSCSTMNNMCQYKVGYLDSSSTRGNLANETITLNGSNGFPEAFTSFTFGCGNNQSGNYGNSDGLVGLGLGDLSLVYQLGSAINNTFSYCMVDFETAMNKTSSLLLGSVGNLSLTYTPILSNPYFLDSFYYLNFSGITVDNAPVDYPSGTFAFYSFGQGGMIIDSGTTITYMFPGAYNPFADKLKSLISYPSVVDNRFDLCYNISGVSNPAFPAVVMQFTGVDLALPTNNVFVLVDVDKVCLAFLSTDRDVTISILGNIQQQNFQISYDLVNNQIGFAPTTC